MILTVAAGLAHRNCLLVEHRCRQLSIKEPEAPKSGERPFLPDPIVAPRLIATPPLSRLLPSNTSTLIMIAAYEFKPGDKIEARWKSTPRWYPGVILKVRASHCPVFALLG